MKNYYSGLQIILILVLLTATVYSIVEYKNETDFNAKLQLVEVKVKEKYCDADFNLKKRRNSNDKSILISYQQKDYWVKNYNRNECEQIKQTVSLYYSAEEDEFYKSLTSNKEKTFFFAILALISLTPLKLLSTKMDKKSKKKKI